MKKFNITWTPGNDGGAAVTGHDVGYTPSGGSEAVVATGSTAAAYTLGGLTDDVEYSVRVRAENSAGKGAWSSAVVQVAALAFSPSDITGLQLWLDASESSTLYDATTGGSLVAADGSVARWEDKSGNDRHATQGTAGARPARKTAIQNGLDVLRFDGSDDFLSHSVIESDPSELTVIAACVPASGATGNVWSHRSEATRVIQLNHDNSPRIVRVQIRGSGNNIITASVSSTDNVFATIGFVFDKTAGSHYAFRNTTKGTAISEAFSGETFTSTLNTIGATDPGTGYTSFCEMDLAELVIYNSALSDTDREAVEDYLIAKWGIT